MVDGVLVKAFPSLPDKKLSSTLKIMLERLGTRQDVEMVYDWAPAEIEEIFAQSLDLTVEQGKQYRHSDLAP